MHSVTWEGSYVRQCCGLAVIVQNRTLFSFQSMPLSDLLLLPPRPLTKGQVRSPPTARSMKLLWSTDQTLIPPYLPHLSPYHTYPPVLHCLPAPRPGSHQPRAGRGDLGEGADSDAPGPTQCEVPGHCGTVPHKPAGAGGGGHICYAFCSVHQKAGYPIWGASVEGAGGCIYLQGGVSQPL